MDATNKGARDAVKALVRHYQAEVLLIRNVPIDCERHIQPSGFHGLQ